MEHEGAWGVVLTGEERAPLLDGRVSWLIRDWADLNGEVGFGDSTRGRGAWLWDHLVGLRGRRASWGRHLSALSSGCAAGLFAREGGGVTELEAQVRAWLRD